MAANITDHLWDWKDIITLIDKAETDALTAKRQAILEMPYSN